MPFMLISALLFAIVGWFLYQLAAQNGRFQLRLENLERDRARSRRPNPNSLPAGAVMHDFELPLLTGGPPLAGTSPRTGKSPLTGKSMTLSEWRGHKVLVIFFDPACPNCRNLVAHLSGDPAITTLILSTGDFEQNRALFEAHPVTVPVLIQEAGEVAAMFDIRATPSGYFVNEEGTTIGEAIVGVGALVDAFRYGPGNATPVEPYQLFQEPTNQQGLKAGDLAPDFKLRQLDGEANGEVNGEVDGKELSLSAYFGQNVLLLFFDAGCPQCWTLAPKIEEIHRTRSDIRVLTISRGSTQANCDITRTLALTFPVALQGHREVSRLYGTLSTPAGYLIGGDGRLKENVAVGEQEILRTLSTFKEKEEQQRNEQTV